MIDILDSIPIGIPTPSLAATRLRTEYEVLKLQVEYSAYRARKEGSDFYSALLKDSRFKRMLAKLPPAEALKLEMRMSSVDIEGMDLDSIEALALDLLKHSDKAGGICKGYQQQSCFTYTCKGDSAQIHCENTVIPLNPFKGAELNNRKLELTKIARDIQLNHPEVRKLTGGSWLRNLKVYLQLFPPEYRNTSEYITLENGTSMGQWGQFYRYDGTFNTERASQFRKTWEFPLKSLKSECPIESFYSMYL